MPLTNRHIYYLKFFILALAIMLGLVFLTNAGFFWKNTGYDLGFRSAVPSPSSTSTPAKLSPNFLSVPSLGITAPIVFAEKPTEKSFQAALLNGVGHYPGTALVGQPGNCYIFGHSSDYVWSKGHYKTVFALLPKIKIGEEIIATDSQGNSYTYIVKNTVIAKPTETKYLKQDKSKKILTLQTSWPIGTALKRYLVIAELKP